MVERDDLLRTRVVVGAGAVAGFVVMTSAMGPLLVDEVASEAAPTDVGDAAVEGQPASHGPPPVVIVEVRRTAAPATAASTTPPGQPDPTVSAPPRTEAPPPPPPPAAPAKTSGS